MDNVVACSRFTDDQWGPVYETADQREYVIDDDGRHLRGVRFIPRGAADVPMIVAGRSE